LHGKYDGEIEGCVMKPGEKQRSMSGLLLLIPGSYQAICEYDEA